MTDPANKFLFETSFDEPKCVVDGGEEPPTFDEADLAAARQNGFETGRQDGLAAAQAQIERHIADAVSVIRDRLQDLATERDAVFAEMTEGGLAIAATIARKVAPDYCRHNALGEVEAVICDCLRNLSDEPRIAIRVSDELLDGVRDRLTAIAEDTGFAGNIAVLNDPGMDCSDCRVEWAEGGADRDVARLLEDIDAAIARSLSLPSSDADTVADEQAEDEALNDAVPIANGADGAPAEIHEPDTAGEHQPTPDAVPPDQSEPAAPEPMNTDDDAADAVAPQSEGNGEATEIES